MYNGLEEIDAILGSLDQDAAPPRQKPAYAAFQAFMAQQK
jgi:hypothetical protein